MFGSSAALPVLYPLQLRILCLMYNIPSPPGKSRLTIDSAFGVFVGSVILFAVLNGAAIAL
jgi:hypothetical protein